MTSPIGSVGAVRGHSQEDKCKYFLSEKHILEASANLSESFSWTLTYDLPFHMWGSQAHIPTHFKTQSNGQHKIKHHSLIKGTDLRKIISTEVNSYQAINKISLSP